MFVPQHFADRPAIAITEPSEQTAPLVVASPHSGRDYPTAFVAAARLDARTLRQSEDFLVDELIAGIGRMGVPSLAALFPRAYLDVNREPYELDPLMFDEPLPRFCNTTSSRVLSGLGSIPRLVGAGAEIYHQPLTLDEAAARIELCYWPYHDALHRLMQRTWRRFGHCVLLDVHSMPGIGAPMARAPHRRPVDIVLGDCHGTACSADLTSFVEWSFQRRGYLVSRNEPYAGGFITRQYGQPDRHRHVLQVELNRTLYMSETLQQPTSGLTRLQNDLTEIAADLIDSLGNHLFPLRKSAAE